MPWLSYFDNRQLDDDYFMLLDNLVYHSIAHGVKISCPYGFISDGPSVPRFPGLYAMFGHRGKRAAVVHDWLYRNLLFPRDICDAIYREALIDSGKFAATSGGMYLGVRMGGYSSFSGKKAGCLDPREGACQGRTSCERCGNFFPEYRMTVIPYSPFVK